MTHSSTEKIITIFQNVFLLETKSPLEIILLLATSILIAKIFHRIILKSLNSLLSRRFYSLENRHLNFIAFLTSSLIPLAIGMIITKQLQLNTTIKNWLNGTLHTGSLITLLLILITVTEHIHKSWITYRFNELGKVNAQLSDKIAGRLTKSRQSTLIILKSIIFLVPVIIACDILKLIPKEIGFSFPSLLCLFSLLLSIALFSSSTSEIKKLVIRKKYVQRASLETSLKLPQDPDSTNKDAIALLFLEIFKCQLEASDSAPAKYTRIPSISGNVSKELSYELQVQTKKEWRKRRMSIGSLGGETGSRSKCYYVVYDKYIVVKVPPKKIATFDQYINMLQNEQHIVNQLRIQECIIPTVSVILNLLIPTTSPSDNNQLKDEKRYIRQLSTSPRLRKYLSISNQYAFFMDLSKYFFLQNTVESMHSINEQIAEELSRQSEIAWDILEFEHRYGIDIVPHVITIKKAYGNFEAQCKSYLLQVERVDLFDPYHTKQWFFDGLAERKYRIGHNAPEDVSKQLVELFDEVIIENLSESITFKSIVKNSIKKTEFYRNKAAMEGIISNLLKLLATLRRTGVSMRDLKPENLLVAGDKKDYPGFLADPNRYSIGLIDVETSVVFKTKNIRQPQMGGTPHYATPSHFFNNQTLANTFPDLNDILHLQDWHGTIAIIYKVITGNVLFEQTVHIIPSVVNIVKEALLRNQDLSQALKSASSMFWERAQIEFKRKISDQEELLNASIIDIPPTAARLLARYLKKDYDKHTVEAVNIIKNQTLWPDNKRKKHLLTASTERITQYKKDAYSKLGQGKKQANRKQEIYQFLEQLEQIKLEKQIAKQFYATIIASEPKISALQLLEIMFQIVHHGMCKKDWMQKTTPSFSKLQIPDMDSTDDATIAVLTNTTKDYHEVR